jgi:hypothetical protein
MPCRRGLGRASGAEWIMNTAKIPASDYRALATNLTAAKYDPQAWAQLAEDAFAQTDGLLQYLSPVILANQGRHTMVFLKDSPDTNAEPESLKLGDYTLGIKYGPHPEQGRGGGGFGGESAETNVSPLRLDLNTRPGASVFVGGPMTVIFKPNTPSHGKVVLSGTVETIHRDGHWLPGRWINGKYTVNLHFAETYEEITAPGLRVFSFNVAGQEFKDVDLFIQAGGALRAYIQSVNVDIPNGKLDIQFTPNIENPEINGLEIIPQP